MAVLLKKLMAGTKHYSVFDFGMLKFALLSYQSIPPEKGGDDINYLSKLSNANKRHS